METNLELTKRLEAVADKHHTHSEAAVVMREAAVWLETYREECRAKESVIRRKDAALDELMRAIWAL